jgi:hypothetical protein
MFFPLPFLLNTIGNIPVTNFTAEVKYEGTTKSSKPETGANFHAFIKS